MDGLEEVAGRLGRRIREIRVEKGLTQKQLAEKAEVFDVGELERGRKVRGGWANPRLETLCKISEALDIDLAELFADIGPEVLELSELLKDQDTAVKTKAMRLIEVLLADHA